MAIFELVGLNEATPQLVAPTVSDVGAIAGSLVVNSNTITPSGVLHVEGNATLNGDVSLSGNNILLSGGHIGFDTGDTIRLGQGVTGMQFDMPGGEYTFLINFVEQFSINETSIDFNGNDLILGGGEIEFGDANTRISQLGADIRFDVATGGDYLFRINSSTRFSITETKIGIHGTILDLQGAHIQFDNTNFTIRQISNDLEYKVITGGAHVFRIANQAEFTITLASVNLHSKNIINVLDIDAATYTVGGTPGVSFSGAVSNITVVNGIVTAAS